MTHALVPVSRETKIALRDKSLPEVAEALLGELPSETPSQEFPALPTPLKANEKVRPALVNLGKIFNKVVLTDRRALQPEERAEVITEFHSIKAVMDLLDKRLEHLKEYAKTDADCVAESEGRAFPHDVTHNGNVVAHATPRDKDGHYLLCAPQNPTQLAAEGIEEVISLEYRSGRSTTDLAVLERMHEDGEMSDEVWKAVTRVVRVPDPEKVREHALKTGDTSLLTRIVKRGLPGMSVYPRKRKK